MDPSIFQSAVPNKSKTTFTLPPRVKTSQLQRRPPNKGKLDWQIKDRVIYRGSESSRKREIER